MRRKLFSAERERLILEELRGGARSLDELSARLGVSTATVRRDLLSMEKSGRAKRVRGGAMRSDMLTGEPVFNEKRRIKDREKELISGKAAELICDGDSVYLDGGSTVLGICRRLGGKKNLSITTNSLMAASELMETGHNLFIVGGKFRPLSRTIVGCLTVKTISSMNFDKAFLGTMGLAGDGISTTDPEEAYTKELVMKRAKKVILLADSMKFGTAYFAVSGSLDDIDVIVTDKKPSAKFAKIIKNRRIELIF